ncbi:MFS transporter [Micromonospora sp. NPDC005171]|uniref:MFS transporter n=1 Tax=Micromonospora sp. NPDC005171 TaxID=3156866 RepID=UPI0033BC60A6
MEKRWWVLVVVLTGAVMDLLDSTVMTVAGPSVRAGLGGTEATLQWLTAGYALPFGVLLVIGGRLGDRWGRRRLFLIGATGFTLASMACAVAASPTMLVAARVAQGALGALMIPQGFGVLTEVFTSGRERGRAFSLFGPVSALAGIGGPILAGVLIAWNLGGLDWRLIFLINVPLGAFVILGALAWMPADHGDRSARLDPLGVMLVAAGSAALVLPLIQGREAGWPWWTFAMLAAAAFAFAALARRQTTSSSPILTPALLRKRPFVAGLSVAVVLFAGSGGLMLILSLFLQLGLHYSALHTGLALAPVAVGIAISSLLVPALSPRLGRHLLHVGLGAELLGALGFAVVAAAGTTDVAFAAAGLVSGLGLGLLFGPLIQSTLSVAAPDEVGSASGTINAVQQIATALGVAVLGTVFFASTAPARALVTGALVVATSCVLCAVVVLALPTTERNAA